MKRYNIHLDEAWVKEIDKILAEMKSNKDPSVYWYWIKRADLIRFALQVTFNFGNDSNYTWMEERVKTFKKFLKDRPKQKGV